MTGEREPNFEVHLSQCRCCFITFDESQKRIKIDRDIKVMFSYLTSMDLIPSKNYSKHICSICNNLLDLFHHYRCKFIQNQRNLEKFFDGAGKLRSRKRTRNEKFVFDTDSETELLVKVEPFDVKVETGLLDPVFVETSTKIDTEQELKKLKTNPSIQFDDSDGIKVDVQLSEQSSDESTEPLFPKKRPRNLRELIEKRKQKLSCPEKGCKKYFLEKHKLEDHLKFDHFGIPFQCLSCDYKTHTRDLLNVHSYRMHGSFVNSREKEQCPECGIFFYGLSAHIKQVHAKNHPFKCDLCGFGTYAIYIIRRHMMSAHFPKDLKKRVACQICNKQLIVSSGNVSLKAHLRLVHGTEGKKRVICFCGLSYKTEQYLKNHQRIVHEKRGKKHHCSVCDKEFVNASQFKEHIYKHKVDGRKEWACDICGKMYGSKSLMLGHQVFHQDPGFVCQYEACEKKFHKSSILKRHVKTAHEIQLTNCEQCGKSYNVMHMQRHTKEFHSGLQKSICLVPGCAKLYLRRDHMRGHIKRLHQPYLSSLSVEEKELFWKNFQQMPMV